ncbi:MAG: hypothetical protein U1E65_34925 [Myxococcota bacterium]
MHEMTKLRCTRFLMVAWTALAACSSGSNGQDSGGGGRDGSITDTSSAAGMDASGLADAMMAPDAGTPCVRDQECPSGNVCDVKASPHVCVPGVACMNQSDCDRCSALTNPIDCKHGFHVNSYCDDRHGNVCVRTLAPCEPCGEDKDCGELNAALRATADPSKCLDYGGGKKYCGRDGRSTFCPHGFVSDPVTMQCKRAEGCSDTTVICDAKPAGAQCPGTDQICNNTRCGGAAGDALCVTNNLPGEIGTCIGACTSNADCHDASFPICNTRNGICIAGCTKDSCAGGKVCHSNGFCGDPCTDDMSCRDRFMNQNLYCNIQGRNSEPTRFKGYRDPNSCAPLGCEQAEDCPAAGIVCDKTAAPPACTAGCYTRDDCLSGEVCRLAGAGGPQQSYTRAECRALSTKADDSALGVCCNPGCTDRVLQCNINEWCCGEDGSPYADGMHCGTVTATAMGGPHRAEPGECFPIEPKPGSPFCQVCGDMAHPDPCNSDNFNMMGANWTAGYNSDPNINGGQPFREQEFCMGIAMGLGMCSVSCNPTAVDNGCPRGWQCTKFFPPCMQDGDCNGLTCAGADPMNMRPGRCQCGENNTPAATCPTAYAGLQDAVDHPRCVADPDGRMFCVASYICQPPALRESPPMSGMYNYPAACLP